jgi:hypothetical protein
VNTVAEVIQATQKLAPEERWELYRQLRETADIQQHQVAELRRDVLAGVQQIERGDVAPLDVQSIKCDVANRFSNRSTN